ncbi:MAG: hypothetical protein WKH64_10330 [Chloroflexia bacterium]
MGDLMKRSHESARPLRGELGRARRGGGDCNRRRGVYGARMTSAGFGGAAVVLAQDAAVEQLRSSLAAEYSKRTGQREAVFVCKAAQGSSPPGSRDRGALFCGGVTASSPNPLVATSLRTPLHSRRR